MWLKSRVTLKSFLILKTYYLFILSDILNKIGIKLLNYGKKKFEFLDTYIDLTTQGVECNLILKYNILFETF